MDGEYIKTKTIPLTEVSSTLLPDGGSTPSSSQESSPDFEAVANTLTPVPSLDTDWSRFWIARCGIRFLDAGDFIADLLRRLYNSPEALAALGLCSANELDKSIREIIQLNKDVRCLKDALNFKNDLLEAEREQAFTYWEQLKAVREMRDKLLYWIPLAQDGIAHNECGSSVMLDELITQAEAQKKQEAE